MKRLYRHYYYNFEIVMSSKTFFLRVRTVE